MELERSVAGTSLDSWPTSDPNRSVPLLEKEYLFSTEHEDHDRWKLAIQADPLSMRHVQRYEACGENAWIQENKQTGHCRVTFNTCKLRVCPICSRIAARRVKSRLEQALQGTRLKKWRLITLTQPQKEETLAASIARLKNSFKKLRKTPNWKKYIRGGYAVLEITYNSKTSCWHPHFHVVAGGLFYPWQELRDDWKTVSEGARITDIRAIKTTAGAIHYLTSYLGKLAQNTASIPIADLTAYYRTVQGQRFLISFGDAPKPQKPDKELFQNDWTNVAPLWQYILALRDGMVWALVLSRKLAKKPLEELAIADHHPPPQV